ncbi:hypothetical protein CZ765_11750 [Corynebacterium casei]|nr:hypothetical protein CZ765_11750 [Corynebacterium casei]
MNDEGHVVLPPFALSFYLPVEILRCFGRRHRLLFIHRTSLVR